MLKVSASPHVRDKDSTSSIMRDVCIALIPAMVASGILFGDRALALLVITVASSVCFEWLSRRLMHREQTISDFSAVVTGILLAFNLPAGIPLWMPIVGAFFAIVVVKQLFGGLGKNFLNPALAARVILSISFPAEMNNHMMKLHLFDKNFLESTDLVSRPTPLAYANAGKEVLSTSTATLDGAFEPYNYWNMFLGLKPGVIGEVCILALLIGAVYLFVRKVIHWHIPVIYIATTLLFVSLAGQDPWYHLLGGGLVLGAFFMATDYVTHPHTVLGQVIFAVGCGVLTGLMRIYGNASEGVSYAIILMNILTPMIDRFTLENPKRIAWKRARETANR